MGDHSIAQVAYQLVLDISADSQLKEHAKKGLDSINKIVEPF